jgi:hypothetical protein
MGNCCIFKVSWINKHFRILKIISLVYTGSALSMALAGGGSIPQEMCNSIYEYVIVYRAKHYHSIRRLCYCNILNNKRKTNDNITWNRDKKRR